MDSATLAKRLRGFKTQNCFFHFLYKAPVSPCQGVV